MVNIFWNAIRFKKVVDPKTGCWLYTGDICPSTGYGRICINGVRIHVHRISAAYHYELNLDDDKSFSCHKPECPHRHCFNRDHLYSGDNRSNQIDVYNGFCSAGHDLSIHGSRYGLKRKRYCKLCRLKRIHRQKALKVSGSKGVVTI